MFPFGDPPIGLSHTHFDYPWLLFEEVFVFREDVWEKCMWVHGCWAWIMCVRMYFFLNRRRKLLQDKLREAVGAERDSGPIVVETEKTGRDGQARSFRQCTDEPIGERMWRECRLRLFYIAETDECGCGSFVTRALPSFCDRFAVRSGFAGTLPVCIKCRGTTELSGFNFRAWQ